MDCQYIEKYDVHEKYILGRLTGEEAGQYEAHLKSCISCQREFEKQKLLISGIREAGQREMKEEIRRQVKAAKLKEKRGMDWGMVLKAAAAVLFFVIAPGMIYYYQHISPDYEKSIAAKKEVKATDSEIAAPAAGAADEMVRLQKTETEFGKTLTEQSVSRQEPSAEKGRPRKMTTVPRQAKEGAETGKRLKLSVPDPKAATAVEQREEIKKSEIRSGPGEPRSAGENEAAKASSGPRPIESAGSGLKQIRTGESSRQNAPPSPLRDALRDSPEQQEKDMARSPGYAEPLDGPGLMTLSRDAIPEMKLRVYPDETVDLILKAGKQRVEIRLIPSQTSHNLQETGQLPEQFPVRITARDSAGWKMQWMAPSAMMEQDLGKTVVTRSGSRMMFRLPDSSIYRIDLQSDTTRAVLMK
ncbi:MAG: hypothetical protein P8184_20845 [Calditrichia bacterium]